MFYLCVELKPWQLVGFPVLFMCGTETMTIGISSSIYVWSFESKIVGFPVLLMCEVKFCNHDNWDFQFYLCVEF
jgi:hypothetical protein